MLCPRSPTTFVYDYKTQKEPKAQQRVLEPLIIIIIIQFFIIRSDASLG
jgi:hypothetical protein